MIFVTVGTENFPFDRLIRAVDSGVRDKSLSDEVFMQIGTSTYKPKNCCWKRFMEFNEMVDFIKKARITITHAGIGTILLCSTLSKVSLVFPRRRRYAEHVDDHQIKFAKRMEKEGEILAAYNEVELVDKIQKYDFLIRKTGIVDNNSRSEEDLVSYLARLLK